VADDDLAADQKIIWLEINKRTSSKWSVITKKKEPLPDAEKWKDRSNKIDLLEE
jgi:ferredoxin